MSPDYGFTERERKALTMKQIRDLKPFPWCWVILGLLIVLFVWLTFDRPLKVEAQVTDEQIAQSDQAVYEEWDVKTREYCTNYLATH